MSGGIEGVVGAAEEALVADAAAKEATAKSWSRHVGGACANCGATLVGPHCHMCGQIVEELHKPFGALLKDALEGLFSLDSRFFKTIPALLFRPGVVTKRHLDGARARYVAPFRLFLVAAVVFLLAVSLVTGDWTDVDFDSAAVSPLAGLEQRERDLADAAAFARESGDKAEADELEEERLEIVADIEEQRAAEAEAGSPLAVRLAQRELDKCEARREVLVEELGERCRALLIENGDENFQLNEIVADWPIGVRRFLLHQSEEIIDDPSSFFEAINNWISRVLIGLFPVYALILAVMHFWKRRFVFYDHLIVSLHFHSFIFVLTTALILLGWFTPVWLLIAIFVLWGHFYIYKVHRVVYGCGRFSSIFRTLVLDLLYFGVLLCVPVVLLITGFLTA